MMQEWTENAQKQ